jgi:hypothetical protein
MKVTKISITKYNPIYRNELGHYQKDDWTSISDIGKKYDEAVFTFNQYEYIEDLYVKTIFDLISFFESKEIKISHLFNVSQDDNFEDYNYKELFEVYKAIKKNDVITDFSILQKLIKLRLREFIPELEILIDKNSNSKIIFGFDFYMYLQTETDKDLFPVFQQIEEYGLFVK